ncbi:MAG: helix-turn-helix transcriptional regulator [Clostridia bacterium]|nr:helix-turn-helix transcriptional regulator [Clostridia bacterium]
MKKIVIPEKVKSYRKEHRLTQGEFGSLLGVSAQAVSKWEKGLCYPDITFLPELAAILGCVIDDLFIS